MAASPGSILWVKLLLLSPSATSGQGRNELQQTFHHWVKQLLRSGPHPADRGGSYICSSLSSLHRQMAPLNLWGAWLPTPQQGSVASQWWGCGSITLEGVCERVASTSWEKEVARRASSSVTELPPHLSQRWGASLKLLCSRAQTLGLLNSAKKLHCPCP